jgi:hypothetical protein
MISLRSVLARLKKFISIPSTLEIFKPFRVPFTTLHLTGFWVTKESSWTYKIYGTLMHILMLEMGIVFQIIYLQNTEDFADASLTLSLWCPSLGRF